MSYEYTAKTNSAENQAKSVVREIIEQSATLELVGENSSTLNVLYPVRPNRQSSWNEDLQFVFHANTFCIVIHTATRDEREELIRMMEHGFEARGFDLKLEED